jgi:hypothetical protein
MKNHKHESHQSCVFLVLEELKAQQDQLETYPTSCFSSLLKKLLKVDTIPFMLLSSKGPMELAGFEYADVTKETVHFHTHFFRIEKLMYDTNCATLSLLRPLTLCGDPVHSICEVERFERTDICVTIDLSCVCGIQCLDVDLLKKVVIEPKW